MPQSPTILESVLTISVEDQIRIEPVDNTGTIALLKRWLEEDATTDPERIAKAERELAEFKANLNANRAPDQPVFP